MRRPQKCEIISQLFLNLLCNIKWNWEFLFKFMWAFQNSWTLIEDNKKNKVACFIIFWSFSWQNIKINYTYIFPAISRDHTKYVPYARHYYPWFVSFLPPFYVEVRFILQTVYVLKTKILHFLSLKSAVYTRERLLIKSGL